MILFIRELAWCLAGMLYGSLRAPLKNLTSISTRASSQRALGEQQGHAHTLAKHIKNPKAGREDPGLTAHAQPSGLQQVDCVPELESWITMSPKQLGN